jgi:hypothetical protein
LSWLSKSFKTERASVTVFSATFACFVLWNLGLIYQWGTHLVPARGPISFREATFNQFHVVPFEITSRLRSYFFRRGDLMQEIERQDKNQLKDFEKP